MLIRLRLWGTFRWLLLSATIVLLTTLSVVLIELHRDQTLVHALKVAAPIGAATAALLSFIATSISLASNWRRQKRAATLAAWTEWSDSTTPARRRLTRALDVYALSDEVGRALAEESPFYGGTIDLRDDAVRGRVTKDLVRVLNGLERLAVGVEMGIYDLDTLRRVGGTIIARQWERGKSYATARRTLADEKRRQERAYLALEGLSTRLESKRLREESLNLDRRRLAILRRSR